MVVAVAVAVAMDLVRAGAGAGVGGMANGAIYRFALCALCLQLLAQLPAPRIRTLALRSQALLLRRLLATSRSSAPSLIEFQHGGGCSHSG